MENNRRNFIKKISIASAVIAAPAIGNSISYPFLSAEKNNPLRVSALKKPLAIAALIWLYVDRSCALSLDPCGDMRLT